MEFLTTERNLNRFILSECHSSDELANLAGSTAISEQSTLGQAARSRYRQNTRQMP